MLQRIGISLEDDLLDSFDKLIEQQGYATRSEAVRDLIRERLVDNEWRQADVVTMAVVMMVYDHHKSELAQRLTDIQHDHYASVVSTLHVHLDHHNCLELLVLKGRTGQVRELGEALIREKGVKYGRFIPATTGRNL
jgi:CopG family nickel-responsive transcriptional regulator